MPLEKMIKESVPASRVSPPDMFRWTGQHALSDDELMARRKRKEEEEEELTRDIKGCLSSGYSF